MTGFGSGRRARVLFAALLLALIVPLVPASSQSVAAQDATGGPELGAEFYDPPACSPAGANGLVVYQTTGDDGVTPERSLVVADQDGRTVRTVKLSGTPIRLLAPDEQAMLRRSHQVPRSSSRRVCRPRRQPG